MQEGFFIAKGEYGKVMLSVILNAQGCRMVKMKSTCSSGIGVISLKMGPELGAAVWQRPGWMQRAETPRRNTVWCGGKGRSGSWLGQVPPSWSQWQLRSLAAQASVSFPPPETASRYTIVMGTVFCALTLRTGRGVMPTVKSRHWSWWFPSDSNHRENSKNC